VTNRARESLPLSKIVSATENIKGHTTICFSRKQKSEVVGLPKSKIIPMRQPEKIKDGALVEM